MMAPKRGASGFIKADPDAKRVKREGGDANINLATIPMAPVSAASASSSAVVPKFDVNVRKSLDVGAAPAHGGQPGRRQKKRRYYGGSIKARRGTDWVSAHVTESAMVVTFTVNRQWPSTWDSEGVEREIIQRLNKAKFEITPTDDWGFIDRYISQMFKNGMSNTLSRSSSSGDPKHLDFILMVKVRKSSQEELGANMDAKENVRPSQYASADVEPKLEAPGLKREKEDMKLLIPRTQGGFV